ncbi:RNA polymerase sigma factor [Draconibacterium sp. IB214405]|uniref:RNA polymerase sigma factor n=1 Tax=Draconibacterium sp. IB214405 TaxID=3097352 RepID=UPI002A0B5AFE|nr:RNA polymerase sigma factor [Draconibacterium sp. IB214405]MDX8339082.1 RNA polymerase sigma factor [Draconibacterium sp. IB214405]
MIFRKKNIARLTDEELMAAIKNGDQSAFSELYERFNQRLYYYFFRMLGNDKEVANDFLQDLFLKIINKPELFKPGYKFSSWIFTVAHNMCKNEYRNREVRKIVNNDENPDQFLADENSFEETLKKEHLITQLFAEIEYLAEDQKAILLLKYKENFSLKEISEVLELPVGTIKSRLYYARIELTKKLANKSLL